MTFAETFYADRFTYREYLDDRLQTVVARVGALHAKRPVAAMLDIGCGSGVLLDAMRETTGATGIGIELNEKAVAECRDRGFEVHSVDVGKGLPFPDGRFDLVTMGEVLEHLVDPDVVLDEIRRVLAPGGSFVVTTPNIAAWFNRVLLLLGIQPVFTETNTVKQVGRYFAALGQGFPPQGHLRIYTLAALREVLEMHRFVVDGSFGCTFPVDTPMKWIDAQVKRFPSFAAGLIVESHRTG